jgi:hypothetical protein
MPDDHALIAATVAARLAEPTVQFSLFLCVSA